MKGRLMLLFISLTVICFCLIISVVFYKQWNGGNQTQHATGDGTIESKTESVKRLTDSEATPIPINPVNKERLQEAPDNPPLSSTTPEPLAGEVLEIVFYRSTGHSLTIDPPPTYEEFLETRSSHGRPDAPSSEPVEGSGHPLAPPPPRDGLEDMEGEDSFAPDWDNGDPSAAKQQAFDAMSEGWIRSDADPAAAVERRIADLERESKPKLSPDDEDDEQIQKRARRKAEAPERRRKRSTERSEDDEDADDSPSDEDASEEDEER